MGWYPRISTGKLSFYRSIPKVELHRHLEGSLRLDTLLDVARQHGLTIPFAHFNSLVQMQQGDPLTFTNFLSKFQSLRMFYRSPEVIGRITREAIMDAASDGVRYMELRFTPVALSRMQGFSYGEVMDWVLQSANEASRDFNLTTRLIVSVNRHEPVDMAEQVIRLAADRVNRGVVGVDLAGSEAEYSAQPFAGLFREARKSGLRLTVHAGEWGGAANVREAIEVLEAERIGHGVRVVEDPNVVAMARERGTVFEVCVTSNYQSGSIPEGKPHPLAEMIRGGLKTTINTDDPGISRITLTDEYKLALEDLGLPPKSIIDCVMNGIRGSFQPAAERDVMAGKMDSLLKAVFQSLH
jgi:adenosine deaminase